MKRYIILTLCVCLLSGCVNRNNNQQIKTLARPYPEYTVSNKKIAYSKDTLIIFFDSEVGDKPLLSAVKEKNAEILYRYSMMNGLAIKLAKGDNLEQCLIDFSKVKGVVSVEKDYISIVE